MYSTAYMLSLHAPKRTLGKATSINAFDDEEDNNTKTLRASFVEQLKMAFRTPMRVDLRYDFGLEVPPVAKLPFPVGSQEEDVTIEAEDSGASATASASESEDGMEGFGGEQSRLVDVRQLSMLEKTEGDGQSALAESRSRSQFDMSSASRIVDMKEPTMMHDSVEFGRSAGNPS
ncbi:hypothetical protein NLJ89_g11709 [Agrocybe chaxingu]|uniref:Uncharacterized protein n=1 Tax=Agrocybe chaxingu TaxID=84603 RepID=A0A9W8MRD3_9AGAR|nr:hypothetical protein NLJ89_g11709 [Agrocybe chaxingu]